MRRMIIEVPEEVLWDIENGHVEDRNVYEYANLIHNGTQLPKGHGDLKDVDAIDLNQDEFISQSDYYEAECAIENAPTIIEADTVI